MLDTPPSTPPSPTRASESLERHVQVEDIDTDWAFEATNEPDLMDGAPAPDFSSPASSMAGSPSLAAAQLGLPFQPSPASTAPIEAAPVTSDAPGALVDAGDDEGVDAGDDEGDDAGDDEGDDEAAKAAKAYHARADSILSSALLREAELRKAFGGDDDDEQHAGGESKKLPDNKLPDNKIIDNKLPDGEASQEHSAERGDGSTVGVEGGGGVGVEVGGGGGGGGGGENISLTKKKRHKPGKMVLYARVIEARGLLNTDADLHDASDVSDPYVVDCTLYSYTVLINYNHTLYSYTVLIHCTHTLYSYTVLIHFTHTLYSYTLLIHFTHTLSSHTVLIHYNHTLFSHTVLPYTVRTHCTHIT
jgi:hypothetical protein